jgi:hypothetical protein
MAVFFALDLGTSNCALAAYVTSDEGTSDGEIVQIPLPQTPLMRGAGAVMVKRKNLLPSVILLPVNDEQNPVIGEEAKAALPLNPDRTIASAKSFLSAASFNRTEKFLPWRSEIATELKLSPVEVTKLLIDQALIGAKEFLSDRGLEGEISDFPFVITVPASFDEVARKLTESSAKLSGIPKPILLEEPLAATYAWCYANEKRLASELQGGDVILVCDVGGGTTDFSLIKVIEEDQSLKFERIAVGEHILLGGDNIDLSLTYRARRELESSGKSINNWEFVALNSLIRDAKEEILSGKKESVRLTVPGRGSDLFASEVTYTLTKKEVLPFILDGFFSKALLGDRPVTRPPSGVREVGLPYAQDPSINRHLASFLQVAGFMTGTGPNLVLFNGGVFNAPILRERICEQLALWFPESGVRELKVDTYDLNVARGGALFSHNTALGKGLRIRAKSARSYYLGVAGAELAVPGIPPSLKGLCVIPHGLEEGSELLLNDRHFFLNLNETVTFSLFSSTARSADRFGDLIEDAANSLQEVALLQVTLSDEANTSRELPVIIKSAFSLLGAINLSFIHEDSGRSWNLEFTLDAALR